MNHRERREVGMGVALFCIATVIAILAIASFGKQ